MIHMRPPRIALLYLLVALGLHWLLPSWEKFQFSFPLVGIAVGVVGFSSMMWGWWLFKKRNIPICPTAETTAMVVHGPYRFTRNPMYLGIVLMLFGIAFYVGTLPMLLAPAAFLVTMNQVFIPYEEEKLERLFGSTYTEYKHRVRRWL